jgi:glyoxylase-like metal-dependent hydrolase (beta-lactamase superfamily II)
LGQAQQVFGTPADGRHVRVERSFPRRHATRAGTRSTHPRPCAEGGASVWRVAERLLLDRWREVGDRVYVRQHTSYDLNVGLVVGDGTCLVIDTRKSRREADELISAIRQITPQPWVVVNTHAHFDHYFGNSAFLPAPIWAHERCAEVIRHYGEVHRELVVAEARRRQLDDLVAELSEVDIRAPTELFTTSATLDVGGRAVELRHLGPGHTDNDIVATVPDANVLFTGDLVEEGAPPAFDDSFPLDWPSTMDALLALTSSPVVVPGHGDVVDRSFVEGQRDELAAVATLARQSFTEGMPIEDACAHAPFPAEVVKAALARAYRQLRGEPAYDSPDEVRAQFGL